MWKGPWRALALEAVGPGTRELRLPATPDLTSLHTHVPTLSPPSQVCRVTQGLPSASATADATAAAAQKLGGGSSAPSPLSAAATPSSSSSVAAASSSPHLAQAKLLLRDWLVLLSAGYQVLPPWCNVPHALPHVHRPRVLSPCTAHMHCICIPRSLLPVGYQRANHPQAPFPPMHCFRVLPPFTAPCM